MPETTNERYNVTPAMVAELEKRFRAHAPQPDQISRFETIRELGRGVATATCRMCPESRERATALTNLEQFVFWANAAIARNEAGQG